jgi:hypothetical protein
VYFGSGAGEPVVMAVADSVNARNASAQYCWKMHTDAANAVGIIGHNFTMVAPSGAAAIGSVASNGGKPQIVATPYPSGSNPALHTVLQTDTTTDKFEHLAVVALQQEFQWNSLSVVSFGATGGNAANVTWSGGLIAMAAANRGATLVDTGIVKVAGAFGKVTIDKGSSVLERGTLLEASGRTYVSVTGGGVATVVVGGPEVRVTNTSGLPLTCSVYAPQVVTSVLVNGTSVVPTRVADTLTFAC